MFWPRHCRAASPARACDCVPVTDSQSVVPAGRTARLRRVHRETTLSLEPVDNAALVESLVGPPKSAGGAPPPPPLRLEILADGLAAFAPHPGPGCGSQPASQPTSQFDVPSRSHHLRCRFLCFSRRVVAVAPPLLLTEGLPLFLTCVHFAYVHPSMHPSIQYRPSSVVPVGLNVLSPDGKRTELRAVLDVPPPGTVGCAIKPSQPVDRLMPDPPLSMSPPARR
eukprot:SAG22_NODE_56_length_23716_cov_11.146759_16_plen_224_part_00